MSGTSIRLLHVEDNPWDVQLVRAMLNRAGTQRRDVSFELVSADRLSSAMARLAEGNIDAVLLDLVLPDSEGIETLVRLRAYAPDVPIVVQTSLDDEGIGLDAVKAGAQDYLVKGRIDAELLVRAICYAMERNRLQVMVRQLSLTDDLTGLLNRRGFHTLAEQHLRVVRRHKVPSVLLLGDLDHFKQINDSLGHQRGDEALIDMANLLRETFRESDIVARLGGDEFAVIATNAPPESTAIIVQRLDERLAAWNARTPIPYALAMSTGVLHIEPGTPLSLEQLLAQVDELMYEQKRVKRGQEAPAAALATGQ